MKLRFAAVLSLLLALIHSPARAQNEAWPKNEYGSVQLTGQRLFEGQEATRKSFQQRVLTWFTTNLEQTRLAEGGRLSARGEFYGWGRFAPMKAGQNDYQLLLGVGARLVGGEATFRVEDMKCAYRRADKLVTVPLETFLASPDSEHKLAAAALWQRLNQFIAAL